MTKDEVFIDDYERILFGTQEPVFLIEVFFRTLAIYILLLIALRWLGKRMASQKSITETGIMIMLGAILAAPMQMSDRGLLPGILILLIVTIYQRGIHWLGFKHATIEKLTQGHTILLVKDGILLVDEMKKIRLTKQELFANIRNSGIYNLGTVKRCYLEACGHFSIYKEDGNAGLPIYPNDEKTVLQPEDNSITEILACTNCGTTAHVGYANGCSNCGNNNFVKAVLK